MFGIQQFFTGTKTLFLTSLFFCSLLFSAPTVQRIPHISAYYNLMYTWVPDKESPLQKKHGIKLQLNDSSLWEVNPSYLDVLQGWAQLHRLTIQPNPSFYSTYHYLLHNVDTKNFLEVNIASPPSGAYLRWIIDIDADNKFLKLNDNSVWEIDPADSKLDAWDKFGFWRTGDRIMTGINNPSSKSPYFHILINTSLIEKGTAPYLRASFVQYEAQEIYK